jgi:hypothetical protein
MDIASGAKARRKETIRKAEMYADENYQAGSWRDRIWWCEQD